MSSTSTEGLLTMDESEREAMRQLERVLRSAEPSERAGAARVIGAGGEEVVLPDNFARMLRHLAHLAASGQRVVLFSPEEYLSTQEAADMLNVSRPYLIKLLEDGAIPFIKTGTHRRIQVGDLLDYKRRRDATRRHGLAQLTQMSQDMGLYG